MDVNNRARAGQAVEKLAEAAGRLRVPDALKCGGRLRGIADQVTLTEADRLDARRDEFRGHGTGGGEHDRAVAGALQSYGAVEGDAGLAARHRGMIEADHHRQRHPVGGGRGDLSFVRHAARLDRFR